MKKALCWLNENLEEFLMVILLGAMTVIMGVQVLSLIVSESFFEELTREEQEILLRAGETAKEYSREASDERIAERIEAIEAGGAEIVTLTEEMHRQMTLCSQPVYEEIRENVSGEIVEQYLGKSRGFH